MPNPTPLQKWWTDLEAQLAPDSLSRRGPNIRAKGHSSAWHYAFEWMVTTIDEGPPPGYIYTNARCSREVASGNRVTWVVQWISEVAAKERARERYEKRYPQNA